VLSSSIHQAVAAHALSSFNEAQVSNAELVGKLGIAEAELLVMLASLR
jgi:hypothetical protein